MEIRDPAARRSRAILPVVRYADRAAHRRRRAGLLGSRHALELAVIARDARRVRGREAALAAMREPWEPESTANNLSLIREDAGRDRRDRRVGRRARARAAEAGAGAWLRRAPT